MGALIPVKVAHNILEGRQDFMISIDRIEFLHLQLLQFFFLYMASWQLNFSQAL
jgi:hypothetical protein